MKTGRNLYKLFFVLGITLIMFAGTYSFFVYSKSTNEISAITGDIFLNLNKDNTNIILSNSFPESYEDAITHNEVGNRNYIDFTIIGKNEYKKNIYYEIDLEYGEDVQNKIRISDKFLDFELVDITDTTNPVILLSNVSFNDLNNKKIFVDTVPSDTDSYSRTFRLRTWIDEKTFISDTNPKADFKSTEYATGTNSSLILFSNLFASIKVRVIGDFIEKEGLRTLNNIIKEQAISSGIQSQYVQGENGIDFTKRATHFTTPYINGNGVYYLEETENDPNPIYFFRGGRNPLNNVVLFADKCWKIFRTTETGGTKIQYFKNAVNGSCDGSPNQEGTTNIFAKTSQTFKTYSTYDYEDYSASIGYYHDIAAPEPRRTSINDTYTTQKMYGTSYSYSGGKYKLINAQLSDGNVENTKALMQTNKYTCNNSSTACNTLYEILSVSNSSFRVRVLEDGITDEDVKKHAFEESNNDLPSTAATTVNNFYETNLLSYTDYIEDSVYCNDRRFELGYDENYDMNYYTQSTRRMIKGEIDFSCAKNDSFTVSKAIGNGVLPYPIGLITSDEVSLTGYAFVASDPITEYNPGAVLASSFTTMTPFLVSSRTDDKPNNNSIVHVYGRDFYYYPVQDSKVILPVITLINGITVSSGNGSLANPYVVE